MAKVLDNGRSGLVLVGDGRGRALIPRESPLTRLNYFDGKLLRAEDLRTEQEYVRKLVHLSNRAGGSGVVHGFDLSLGTGDELRLGAGMAVDGAGRVLLLPTEAGIGVPALLEASRRGDAREIRIADDGSARFVECELAGEPAEEEGLPGRELYLIVLSHAEALCGQEDVYGRLCERACETDTERPYRVEGVSLRALPLSLDAPLPDASAVSLDRGHLRSRVASAFFRAEDRVPGALLSRSGLSSRTWCAGARYAGEEHLALGVLAREGETTLFLDAWIARRERMETPPRRYWAGRMAMRPWNAYLAQILQFQCQLVDALGRAPEPGTGDDPCGEEKEVLAEARAYLRKLKRGLPDESEGGGATDSVPDPGASGFDDAMPGGIEELTSLSRRVVAALQSFSGRGSKRILVDGGIVELPPAGYLPVTPDSEVSVNRQVRELTGEGVDLRFCVVRPDFPAHALEEAQHMDRISLLEGLDDPARMPEVDVLVPDGEVAEGRVTPGLFDATLEVTPPAEAYGPIVARRNLAADFERRREVELPSVSARGVARADRGDSGGGVLRWAGSPAEIDSRISVLLGRLLGEVFEEDRAADGEAENEMGEEEGSAEEAGPGGGGGSEEEELQPNQSGISATDTIDTGKRGPEDLEVGLWTTFRYDLDPFELDEGDRLPCRLEAALGASAEGRAGTVEVEAEGSLVVREVVSREEEGRWMVEGRLRRVVLLLKPTLDGEPLRVESESVSLSAELELRTERDGPAKLVLRLGHESGTTVTVTGVRREDRVEGDLRLRAVERRNPDSRITEKSTSAPFSIRGTVRSLRDGSPVEGARVVVRAAQSFLREARTDASGGFHFGDLGAQPTDVEVSHPGMKGAETTVDMADESRGVHLTVELAPENGWTEERAFHPAQVVAERTGRVLETDHAAHRRAVAALDLVGRGLDDPTFRPRAESELFAKDRATEEPVIRGTRDWVLFHRRRVKECAPRSPRPERTRDRRYRVYHLALAGDSTGETARLLDRADELLEQGNVEEALAILNEVRAERGAPPLQTLGPEELAEAIRAEREHLEAVGPDELAEALRSDDPDALADFDPEEVATVTFAGDGVSLTTPTTEVLEAWRSVGPGGSIVLGAIGTRGEALEDGVVLAEGRLDRLEATLERVTSLGPDAVSLTLPSVPPALDVTGADGVVVVATGVAESEVRTECVNLFRRVVPRHQIETVLARIEDGAVGEMASFYTARFREGTTEMVSDMDELQRAWLDVEDGRVREVWAYGVEEGSLTVRQAAEPARAMDFDPDTRVVASSGHSQSACPRADWVVLADDHRVRVVDDPAEAFFTVDQMTQALADDGIGEESVGFLADFDRKVFFEMGASDVLSGVQELQETWADSPFPGRFADRAVAVVTACRPGADDADVEAQGEQGGVIREVLGLPADTTPTDRVRSQNLDGFGGAAAVTLVIPLSSQIG